jgi:hypothetical protein
VYDILDECVWYSVKGESACYNKSICLLVNDYDECIQRSGCYWDGVKDSVKGGVKDGMKGGVKDGVKGVCEDKPDCGDLKDPETCTLAKDIYGMFAFYFFVSVVVVIWYY